MLRLLLLFYFRIYLLVLQLFILHFKTIVRRLVRTILVGSLTIHGTITIKYVLILMGKLFRISICNIAKV